MMNWLRKLMYGRYGMDALSMALMGLWLVLYATAMLTRFYPVYLLAFVPAGFAVFRSFSRNIYKRQSENRKFLAIWEKLKAEFLYRKQCFSEIKTHLNFRCPHCKAKIRVPRVKGTHTLSCPRCGEKITKTVYL